MVKISIIVPIYNAEKYLEQCLQSIKNQTLKDIEVICVDDGSTDSSPQIMDRFQNEDQRFKVIHKSNGGNGHSMNTGLAAATGEYIGCVEADMEQDPMSRVACEAVLQKRLHSATPPFAPWLKVIFGIVMRTRMAQSKK